MGARGIAILLVLLVATPPAAWAQAHDKKVAAAHFKEARGLYDQGRWAEALTEFQAGYEAFPLPGFLVNIGQCYRKLERLELARDTWQKFLESNPSDERLRAEVDEALVEVRGELDKRAQEEAARAMQAEAKRRAVAASIAREHAAQEAALTHPDLTQVVASPTPEPRPTKKSKWWVWTLVGVIGAGAVASAVAVGVIYGQPQGPQPGSLGLLDGRRP
jgi:tetratricopeptide (TPR) repeat protein